MGKTDIAWADNSWNPYKWNCIPASPGCAHCYAAAFAKRRPQNANQGRFNAPPAIRDTALAELPKLSPGVVFVNSMSDTFIETAPAQWIHMIFNTAINYPHLFFLVLTKRIERAYYMAPYLAWPPNLGIGTTVENADYVWRLEYLRRIHRAALRFVSFEPLLGPLPSDLNLDRIDWVIVGGESGAQRRAYDPRWAMRIRMQTLAAHIPFFYKQGSATKPGQDRVLYGATYNGVPDAFKRLPEPRRADPHGPTQLRLL